MTAAKFAMCALQRTTSKQSCHGKMKFNGTWFNRLKFWPMGNGVISQIRQIDNSKLGEN